MAPVARMALEGAPSWALEGHGLLRASHGPEAKTGLLGPLKLGLRRRKRSSDILAIRGHADLWVSVPRSGGNSGWTSGVEIPLT